LFVSFLKDADLITGETIAIDGTKSRAHNSKKANFSQKKIDRHIEYIDQKVEEYMSVLASADVQDEQMKATPISPPYGPATDSFNGLYIKSNFFATIPHRGPRKGTLQNGSQGLAVSIKTASRHNQQLYVHSSSDQRIRDRSSGIRGESLERGNSERRQGCQGVDPQRDPGFTWI
jgi:hypothetical protein